MYIAHSLFKPETIHLVAMETPMVPMPKDSEEREILERLTIIRDKLLLLKQDRTKYIRSQDIVVLYDETVDQVRRLNEARKGKDKSENKGMCRSFPAVPVD